MNQEQKLYYEDFVTPFALNNYLIKVLKYFFYRQLLYIIGSAINKIKSYLFTDCKESQKRKVNLNTSIYV